MKIEDISRAVRLGDDGIWSCESGETVSYPSEGNVQCFLLEDGSFWFQHRNECIVALLERFPPAGPFLDVGGGNGFVTRRILDEGMDAVLLEPGPDGARNGHDRRRIPDVIRASLAEASLIDDSVGAAGVFDVLEHQEDDRAFVALLSAALMPEGMLYGTVPAHRWLWSAADVSAGHQRRYDEDSLRRLLRPSFDVLYVTPIFEALLFPSAVFRALPYRIGLRRPGVLRPESEHGLSGGPALSAVRRLLEAELRRLRSHGRIRFGTSLLFAARKRRNPRV